MSGSAPSLENVTEYLERALDADPGEKDFHIRHALQAVAELDDEE